MQFNAIPTCDRAIRMIFHPTMIEGAFIIEPERLVDERGFFARSWCHQAFADRGLDADLSQCNISFNHRRGTLRGMHFQKQPHGETKLVRCTMGAIFDVLVDLRVNSPSYLVWQGFELTAENRRMLYIPEDVAHGFITRADSSEVFYQMSGPFHSSSASGVRWNDPALGIDWPEAPVMISERDNSYSDYSVAAARPLERSLP